MTEKARHPGVHPRGSVDDQSRAGKINQQGNGVTALPMPFPPLTTEQRDKIAALLRAPATRPDGEATPAQPMSGEASST